VEPGDLAARIDQSVLRPDTQPEDVDRACGAALVHRFRGVCVPPSFVAFAARRLQGSGVRVVSVVAFPHGTSSTTVKALETAHAVGDGADDVDYVVSIGAASAGDLEALREESRSILGAARGRVVKAILETGHLTEERTYAAARVLAQEGVHFVKTSTGFGPRGATEEDVRLLADAVRGVARVKASGGIRTAMEALRMLVAGASVVGTSRGPEMCEELRAASSPHSR
jgi:deoxyribose-phosphate aldolase